MRNTVKVERAILDITQQEFAAAVSTSRQNYQFHRDGALYAFYDCGFENRQVFRQASG